MTAAEVDEADPAEAAAVLRQVLEAVVAGELEAKGPLGARLVRRLEGAAAALAEAAGR